VREEEKGRVQKADVAAPDAFSVTGQWWNLVVFVTSHLRMHSNLLPVLTSAATLLSFVQGQSQQPYRDWAKAYEAAEALVLPWTIEQQANISVRYGTAPGFVPFEPSDGEYIQSSCSCTSL
jgi:hypothetical protein